MPPFNFHAWLHAEATAKRGSSGSNSQVWFSTAAMQGWRIREFLLFIITIPIHIIYVGMQDKHKTILNLNEGIDNTKPVVTYLALFDGHGIEGI